MDSCHLLHISSPDQIDTMAHSCNEMLLYNKTLVKGMDDKDRLNIK